MFPLLLMSVLGGIGPKTYLAPDPPAGGGKKEDEDEDDNNAGKKPIPYVEHAKARRRIRELEAQIKEHEGKAPEVAKIAQERDQALARATNAERDVQLRDLGITDPDDRAYIRDRYRTSTDGVKDAPEFGDWIEAQKEKRWFQASISEAAPAADPAKKDPAPRSEYEASKRQGADPTKKETAADPNKKETAKPAFNPNRGAKDTMNEGGARPAFTREEIGNMTTDEYKKHREEIRAAQLEGRIE